MTAQRECMYCGKPTPRGKRGEHILPAVIGGKLTLNDVSDRVVSPDCNNGFLSYLDKELCCRSFLATIASYKTGRNLWQAWDIDHSANNLLLEGRPCWAADGALDGFRCFPQIVFEYNGRTDIRGDSEEFAQFGLEHAPVALFTAVRRCFEKYNATGKGLHFERIKTSIIYEDCRLPPRIYTPHSIREIAKEINDRSFVLRFLNEGDKRLALRRLSNLGEGRQIKRFAHLPGSYTPTLCCYYDAGDVVRALIKIGLNLLAAYCPNTVLNRETLPQAIGLIQGDVGVTRRSLAANGFVHPNEDLQRISGAGNDHAFRLVHAEGTWHVCFCFFGGSIAAYCRFPGPNCEPWNYIDIAAPFESKEWRIIAQSRILPPMKPLRVEWGNLPAVAPCVKFPKSKSTCRVEIKRRKATPLLQPAAR